jgi:ankyrin repeat protein
MSLLVSSGHPAAAGLQAALVNTLLDFGAAANGVADDGAPLMTAIAFGHPKAARVLADRGARSDNVFAAAALGRLDLVERFVLDARTLAPGVPLVAPRWYGLPADAKVHIEHAFVAACKFGRLEVVERLLDAGVDHRASDGLTGLHWAAGHRYLEVVMLLLARGAALEAKNAWGGTVLDSTVWSAKHPPVDHPQDAPDPGYVPILEALLAAGADARAVSPFPTALEPIDTLLRRHRHD